jgi:CheY-like chemotaxis protein
MEKDTVLVVDDSTIICNIIKDILESPTLHRNWLSEYEE